jgi:MazG family protein
VARQVHEKLVRRHPHVFGEADAPTAGRVRENWERIKSGEEGRQGIFHDVPESLPALLRARKVQRRARDVGFEYPDLAGALADLESELAELKAELTVEPAPETEADLRHFEELGDLLFAVVNVGRRLNVDPELALRSATGRFRARVEWAEQLAASDGSAWAELPLEEQDRYYDRAKEALG